MIYKDCQSLYDTRELKGYLMHISLTEKLDEYVKGKVQSGLYNNASEVVREALRHKIVADETDEIKRQKLRDAIDPAWKQADLGEFAQYSLSESLNKLRIASGTNG